jgi:hypothetical protein
MRANVLLSILLLSCVGASSEKPFDQMTAQEHRAAASRHHALANDAFEKITGDNIVPPEVIPEDVYETAHAYPYDEYPGEIDDPEHYTAWPRIGDPSEKYEDRASEHREKALQHEAAAALLEGKPSPRPLPPPQEPLIEGLRDRS